MGAAVVVEFDIEGGEVANMVFTHVGDEFFFAAAFLASSQHDRRTMRVVSAHIDDAMTTQLLKTHPDIGLDVLDQMPDVNLSVGVGQCRRDEDLAL